MQSATNYAWCTSRLLRPGYGPQEGVTGSPSGREAMGGGGLSPSLTATACHRTVRESPRPVTGLAAGGSTEKTTTAMKNKIRHLLLACAAFSLTASGVTAA